MRTYEKTHEFIKFSLDLRNAPAALWITLGECQSKCGDISSINLPPDIAKNIQNLYQAKGLLATLAIEGNTLTEQEVLQHLDNKLEITPSRAYLVQELDNICAGHRYILENMGEIRAGKLALNPDLVKKLNELILAGLSLEEGVVPGRVRQHEKQVIHYRPAPASDCEFLLERLCDWINRKTFTAPPGMAVVYGLIKAVVTHLYLAWIHPFADGNGRTARLLELLVLLSAGVPLPAAQLLTVHYHLTRSEYFRQLDQSSRSGGEVEPFLLYAAQGFRDGLATLLERIHQDQAQALWQAHVLQTFQTQTGPAAERQRRLILALSEADRPVPLAELPDLSPFLAKAYAARSMKTLARDVQALIQMGLAEKGEAGIRARREILAAFRPIEPADILG